VSLKLQTAAPGLPLSLAEAKLHLRVDIGEEDALITSMIAAATLDAEHLMGRALMPQKWLLSLDSFPRQITLNRPPVTAVDAVTYASAGDGATSTMSPADYQLLSGNEYFGLVVPAFGKTWPAAAARPQSVQILFSTGYADAASVPAPITAWIKLRIGALYENREAWTAGQKIEQNSHVDFMLDRFRTWLT
jgi:uncharacterized phiE125 gp8 family phage protein